MPGASTYACQQHKIYARTVPVCKSRHAHAQYVQNVRINVHFGAFFVFFNFKFMCASVLEGHQKKPMPTYYQCVKTVGGHAAETEHVPEG